MQEPQVAVPSGGLTGSRRRDWGLGWSIFDWCGRTVIGHDGGTIGQAAFLRVVPDAGAAIALLTNGGDPIALFRELYGELLRETAGIEMPADAVPPEPPLPVDPSRTPASTSARARRFECGEGRRPRRGADDHRARLRADAGSSGVPAARVAEDDDLFLTQHPAAPGVWLPVRFVTLARRHPAAARRRACDPKDRRLTDGQRGRCGRRASLTSRTNESISIGSPAATRRASPLKTALANVARSISSRSVRSRPSACAATRLSSSVSSALAAAHSAHELGVVPEPYLGLDEDGQPVPVGGGDRPQRRPRFPLLVIRDSTRSAVLDRELDEQVELRVEVVEDRAPRQADLRFQPRDRRALVPVLGERAAGAFEDLVPGVRRGGPGSPSA